jgi:hypothetical protein
MAQNLSKGRLLDFDPAPWLAVATVWWLGHLLVVHQTKYQVCSSEQQEWCLLENVNQVRV